MLGPTCIKGITSSLFVQSRTLCHKSKLPPNNCRKFPYEKIGWNWFTKYLDPLTKNKFDENSKIIQVDGNIGTGKDEFARKLADELGMLYLPKVDPNDIYINKTGYDYRALNPLLPERLRICDLPMFHENPARHSVIHMQHYFFKMRLFQYLKALRHLFNTGQGVVMVRSIYTERVFVEAMNNLGWLPKGYTRVDGVRFYDWIHRYNFIRKTVLSRLLPAHLTIFLDKPVELCLEHISRHPDPVVANSKALTKEFLQEIDTAYDNISLPKLALHGRVHVLEHLKSKNDEDMLDVIDDLEKIDFEIDHKDTVFHFWDDSSDQFWWSHRRYNYSSDDCYDLISALDIRDYDIAGLGDSITDADLVLRQNLYNAHVGPFGYNIAKYADLRFTNPLKAYFAYSTFEEKLDTELRADFE